MLVRTSFVVLGKKSFFADLRATLYRDRVRLKKCGKRLENGPLDISSRDNLWHAKNRDISFRF